MEIRNEGAWEEINRNRDFMKFDFSNTSLKSDVKSDQDKKLPQPPLGNACKGKIIELQSDFEHDMENISYANLLDIRRSERVFNADIPMTQTQLAFLLWSTQGVQKIHGNNYCTFRPVPSGGARHSFELYFIARAVEGLKQGIYRYAPFEHVGEKRAAVELISEIDDCESKILELFLGYKGPENASVILLLSCVAYRSEWRYGTFAHRAMLIDLGHVGQNIMLSASAMGLGSCCYAAYDQDLCDRILCIDGYEEYTVYACTVGSIRK